MSKKQHKNMDRTSAAMAVFLDKKREENKKRQQQHRRDKTSLSRGGFR